ncbi:hypothetical protein LCGC14_2033350 [marine sediment metagenome]|uniref:Uncharacterized protein n=1 Tax=marine sediment metagenome TaxID=412755 RepID=A0A0F9EU87_9ZZZZ
MKHVQFYSIRHIPTGNFLSVPIGRSGKGGTWTEPVPLSNINPPRLFCSEHAAKIALTYWLKGRFSVTHSTYSGEWGEEHDEIEHTEPAPERKREDMEIVPMILTPHKSKTG